MPHKQDKLKGNYADLGKDIAAYEARQRLHEEPVREDSSPDPEWKKHRDQIQATVEVSHEHAQVGKKVGLAAKEESLQARLATERPKELKMDSMETAQADMAKQHHRDERVRIMKGLKIQEDNKEYLYVRKRELATRQWQMQQQIEAAKERARIATEHRRSLGMKAMKGLYLQALMGDQLVRVMFVLKQNFGVHQAAMRIGATVLKAWALHDLKACVVDWQSNVAKNKAYLAARRARETTRRRVRAYGDEVFKSHALLEAVFPVCPPSPRWGGAQPGVPIKWRLENGEIQRVLADPEQEPAPRGGISPPRRPGYEMLRGDYT